MAPISSSIATVIGYRAGQKPVEARAQLTKLFRGTGSKQWNLHLRVCCDNRACDDRSSDYTDDCGAATTLTNTRCFKTSPQCLGDAGHLGDRCCLGEYKRSAPVWEAGRASVATLPTIFVRHNDSSDCRCAMPLNICQSKNHARGSAALHMLRQAGGGGTALRSLPSARFCCGHC